MSDAKKEEQLENRPQKRETEGGERKERDQKPQGGKPDEYLQSRTNTTRFQITSPDPCAKMPAHLNQETIALASL
jgi:hypothetical protein